jgi:hypothetical protein
MRSQIGGQSWGLRNPGRIWAGGLDEKPESDTIFPPKSEVIIQRQGVTLTKIRD